METQSAFVRTDSAVELNAVAKVGLHLTFVVHPCYTEREDSIGLNHTLDDLRTFKLRVLVVGLFDGLQHFLYSL